MATVKSFSDLEQSRKLAEILPLESADMYYMNGTKHVLVIPNYETDLFNLREDDVPCWSLVTLFSVLPKIHGAKPIVDLEECSIQYTGIDLYVVSGNIVDACYEMILKLHELKML